MLFQVTHTTRYAYQTPVSHSLNEVRLTPRALAVQHVRQTEIRVQPEPAFMHRRKDYYGNDVTSFELVERHDQLEVTAESIVEVQRETGESQPSISATGLNTDLLSAEQAGVSSAESPCRSA